MDVEIPPTFFAAEAEVFARAALRMLQEGEVEQAAKLFLRAFEFATKAA